MVSFGNILYIETQQIMKNNTKANLAFLGCIASIIAIVLIFCQIWTQCNPIQQHNTTTTDSVIIKHSTDTILQTDTIWKEKTIVKTHLVPTKITPIQKKASGEPKISQTIKHSPDTFNCETAQLVQQQAHYEWQGTDTTNKDIKIDYRIEATGTDVTLDLLHLNAKYAEINNKQQINNNIETYKTHSNITSTVTTQKKHWKPYIGITVGAGIGLFTKKPDVFIGLGIVAPLYK